MQVPDDLFDQLAPDSSSQDNVQDRLVRLNKEYDGVDTNKYWIWSIWHLVWCTWYLGWSTFWYLGWCINLSELEKGVVVHEGNQVVYQLRAPPELFLGLTYHVSAKV